VLVRQARPNRAVATKVPDLWSAAARSETASRRGDLRRVCESRATLG